MAMRRWILRMGDARNHTRPYERRIGAGSFLMLLMAFVLMISSSSCSKQSPTLPIETAVPGSGNPTAPVIEAEEQPDTEIPSGTPQLPANGAVNTSSNEGVITFAIYSFLEDAYKPILEEFHQQYPGITVQVREAPATLDARQIASAADTALLMFRPRYNANYFLDVTPFKEVDAEVDPDFFWPGILEACKDAEGRAYGLPVSTELSGIYYQEEAFDEAGLAYPQPGWTWDDFQQAVTALTRFEDGQPVYGFADDSFIDTPDETLLSTRISFLINQANGDIDVDLLEKELTWYLNLVQAGNLYSANTYPQQSPAFLSDNHEAWSTAWNSTWLNFHAMFLNHPPAMWKGRLDQIYWGNVNFEALPDGSTTMGADSGPILESKQGIGWVPFPVSADGHNDQTTSNFVTCGVISAGAQNPGAAWTWLKFLAAHPILPEWSLAVPAQPSAAEMSGYWNKIPEKLWEPVRFGLEHGWYSYPYPEEVKAVNLALLKAVAENTNLRAALVEASSQIETAVKPTPDTVPIVVPPPAPTTEPSEIVINFYSPLFFEEAKSKSLVEAFQNRYPNISVQFAMTAETQGVAGLAGAFDCFAWLPERDLPADQLYDLSQFLLVEQDNLLNDFNQGALDEFSQEGAVYGLPAVYRPDLIYYNTDLLIQRGLQPPETDWTYSDFIQMINAAASNSEPEPVYGFALEYPTADFDMFLAGQNTQLVDTTGGIPTYDFDTTDTHNTVEWLADQVNSGVIFPITPLPIGTHPDNNQIVRQLILDGQVAFWMSWFDEGHGGSYSLQEADFAIGTATIPLPEGGGTWRPNHLALGLYISRKAQNPQACWNWNRFFSEQADRDYGIPALRSIRQSQNWMTKVGPELAGIYEAALDQRRMHPRENTYALGPVRDWWNELLAEVVYGADPLPLLEALQRKADAYSGCLASSGDYQGGDAQQKAQAEIACAEQFK